MKQRIFCLAFLFCVSAIFASDKWPQEPKGFRGIDFGASEATAKQRLALQCIDSQGNRLCGGPSKIGDVDVKHTFLFAKDKLVQVSISFNSESYESVKSMFIKNYGQPMKAKKTTIQNQQGASVEKESLSWEGEKVMVFLTSYNANQTSGLASVATEDWLDQNARQ
jgi:hypothetical protein